MLQNVYRPEVQQSFLKTMVQTIGQIESMQGETKNSIDEARHMLSDIYESNIDSFQQCFTEYNQSILATVSQPSQ